MLLFSGCLVPNALVRSLRLFRYQVFFCGNLQPTQTTTSFLNLLSLSPSFFGLCANHVRVQPRSPQTVRVGGGSNCFPLVGTRDPPTTHPASSGGSWAAPNVYNVFIWNFAIFRFEFVVIGPNLAEVQCLVKVGRQFLFSMQMTKSHVWKLLRWRQSERTARNLPN